MDYQQDPKLIIEWSTRTILVNGHSTKLTPKCANLFKLLLEASPSVVSRDVLIEKVWEGNIYSGEKSLTNNIWQLRKALESLSVSFQLTNVPKEGYYIEVSTDVQFSDGGLDESKPLVTGNLEEKQGAGAEQAEMVSDYQPKGRIRFKHVIWSLITIALLLPVSVGLLLLVIKLAKS